MPLVVHENFRFQPWYREAKRLVDAGMLGALHAVAFRLRPGDGQGPRAYLDRQPYFQGDAAASRRRDGDPLDRHVPLPDGRGRGGHRAAAARESGDRRRGCRLHRSSSSRAARPDCSTATAQRPCRRESAPDDGRDVARGFRAACCASTATRGCGGSRTTATKPSTPTTAARRHVRRRLLRVAAAARRARTCVHGAPLENTARDYLANLRVQEAVYASHARRAARRARRFSTAARRSGTFESSSGPHAAGTHHGGTHETQNVRRRRCSRSRSPSPRFAVGAAVAQTVLKFSHTDQPGGARQKAAELFAQKVEQYTQGRYKVQVYPAGQLANDPKARRAAAARRHRLHGDRHRHLRDAHSHAQPDRAAVPRRELPAGLEALRRIEMDAGAVRQGSGEGLPLPVAVRGGLPLDDDQGSARHAGRRQGQEAAQLPQRDDALAAGGDGLQRADHAAARGLSRHPAGRGERAGEPDRHHLRQQVLRSRAERHADAARLQPDSDDDLGEDVAEAVARGPGGGDRRRRRKRPTGAGRKSAATTTACWPR